MSIKGVIYNKEGKDIKIIAAMLDVLVNEAYSKENEVRSQQDIVNHQSQSIPNSRLKQ